MKAKTKFTQEQIAEVMEKRGTSRKSAIRWLNRNQPDAPKGKVAALARDVKMAAANDKSEAASAPKQTLTPEERGAARAEGLRLFKLAGKPKKSHFIAVFGKRGPLMTWEQRAAAVSLSSAEDCATKFQSLLAKASR